MAVLNYTTESGGKGRLYQVFGHKVGLGVDLNKDVAASTMLPGPARPHS